MSVLNSINTIRGADTKLQNDAELVGRFLNQRMRLLLESAYETTAIEGCFGSRAYCRLYARECVSCYSHKIGEAGDPAVVIREPGPGERSWVAVARGHTGARGAGRGFRSGARGAGRRSVPRLRPCQPWRRASGCKCAQTIRADGKLMISMASTVTATCSAVAARSGLFSGHSTECGSI